MKQLIKRLKVFVRGYKNGVKSYGETPCLNQTTPEPVPPNYGESAPSRADICGTDVCPKCQSVNITDVSSEDVAKSPIKDLPKFTILGYRMCCNCNHIWEKRVPMWAWYIGLASGVCGFALFLVFLLSVPFDWKLLFFLFVSGAIIIGSIRGVSREKKREAADQR